MSKNKNKKSGRGRGNANSFTRNSAGRRDPYPRNGKGRNGNGSNGNGLHGMRVDMVPHAVPQAVARLSSPSADDVDVLAEYASVTGSATPDVATLVEESPHPAPSANGHSQDGQVGTVLRARVASPAPVKVRVGSPHSEPLDGSDNGMVHLDHLISANGNGTYTASENGHSSNGNGHTTGSLRRARISMGRDTVVVAPGTRHPTTGHLPASQLYRARAQNVSAATMPLILLRPQRATGEIHSRPLPYFLMRHRNLRARSRVGHTRASVAARRFGSGGPFGAILKVSLVLFMLAGMVAAGGMGAGVGGAMMYLGQLPSVKPSALQEAMDLNAINVQTTKIYDRHGVPLFEAIDEKTGRREEVALKDISPHVISATIAAEDADFYSNPGIDVRGIVRAVNINLSGQGSSGASTITQQLVRLVLLPEEEAARTQGWGGINRKIKEMALAIQLTREYSKDFILETYLNQIFYGHGAYGIQAAANIYFGKNANELSLPEAALLAGLPQQPTLYDPFVNLGIAKKRQAIVLDLMARQGMITPEAAEEARQTVPFILPYEPVLRAPHFVYYVKDYLERKYAHIPNFLQGGYKVYTTLDLDVQDEAQKIAKDRVEEIRRQRASNAAIVIMKPRTGEILAMVGSVDYSDESIDGQVNVAVAERQPGSSFKPITFAAAFEKGWSPATTMLDVLTQFPGGTGQKPYIPKNYDGRDHGWVTVRESLANSYNIPAVKALQYAGIQETLDTAHAMGIKGLQKGLDYYGLSLTLGGGEVTLLDMTTAYSTFANGGMAVDANPILRIEDPQGRIVEEIGDVVPATQALDPRNAYLVTSILSDNRARTPAFGSNSALRTSFPSAAKTGTTDNNRDSWTMGYTPNLAVGVWVGNSDNAEMNRITGAIGAAVIWNKVMEDFHENSAFVNLIRKVGPDGSLEELETEFEQPAGLVRLSVCSARGGVTDLLRSDARPKGCVTYQDPKGNVSLHSLPSERPAPRATPRPQPRQQPTAQPTPMPGILPPEWLP